jgi:hypothetical protein
MLDAVQRISLHGNSGSGLPGNIGGVTRVNFRRMRMLPRPCVKPGGIGNSSSRRKVAVRGLHYLESGAQFLAGAGEAARRRLRALASERRITKGDVCALTAMEMAPTFRHEKKDMVVRPRPCLTIYHYRIDPQWGWMHARIQIWFPFYLHACINGRSGCRAVWMYRAP